MASENTNLIINQLEIENQDLLENNQVLPSVIGIAQTFIDTYTLPAEVLDKTSEIYYLLSQINYKKQEIVTIASSGIGTFSPGVYYPECVLESNKEDLSSPVISEKDEIPASIFGEPTSQIAFGVIREDSVRVKYYPRLENQQASNNNPYGNVEYPALTSPNSSYAGTGVQTILFTNASYNDGSNKIRVWNNSGDWSDEWEDDDNVIGNYYKIVGIGDTCVGWASSITQLEDEIVQLRSEIQSYLIPSNGFKERKQAYQLRIWSYKKAESDNIAQIDKNNSMIDVLNDPQYENLF